MGKGVTWRVLEQKSVFTAHPFLDVVRQRVETDTGKIIDDFYQVHSRAFAICVAQLTNGNFLVIRQYKHGLGRESVTFPAGFLEEGEDPADGCLRELREETGLVAGELQGFGSFVDNGNQRGAIGHYFLATACERKLQPDSGDLETMTLEEMSAEALDTALAQGDIGLAHSAFAWLLARRFV